MDNKHLYNYNYYHQSKNFQTKPERTEKLVEEILKYNPRNVLDVGCGLGAVVNELNERRVRAWGIDFSEDLVDIWHGGPFLYMDAKDMSFWNNREFDLVVSSDFFEHIYEQDIDTVALEMKRVGEKVIAFVADDTGEYLNARQRELHVTHKPLSWWKEKLKGIEVFSSHDYEA